METPRIATYEDESTKITIEIKHDGVVWTDLLRYCVWVLKAHGYIISEEDIDL